MPQPTDPQSFTVGTVAVTQLVQQAVEGDRFAAPIDGSPIVTCSGRTTCAISYTVRETTATAFHKEIAADDQLFLPTARMWKTLFTDPQFQRGTVTVRGHSGNDTETAIYFTLSCSRADAAKIDWANVDGHSIRTQCDYAPQAQGLPDHTESSPTGR